MRSTTRLGPARAMFATGPGVGDIVLSLYAKGLTTE